MLSIPWSFVILEVIGTLAGAVSGARLASSKKFDLFGALIVGIATACGGGTIRDLMIGKPPFWLEEPIYLLACIFGLLWVFVFRKVLVRQNNTWFLFDCIGFSLFNVIGIEKSLGLGFPTWAAICLGCITGAGGGVMRDILRPTMVSRSCPSCLPCRCLPSLRSASRRSCRTRSPRSLPRSAPSPSPSEC